MDAQGHHLIYIDGKETWRTSARVSKAQQYLILSLLASDYEALEMPDKQAPAAHVRRLGARVGDPAALIDTA